MRPFSGKLRALVLATAAAIAASAIPVLAQHVTTDYRHSVNFSQFHTFSFGPVKASDPLFDHRIKKAITADLTARGWQFAPQGGQVTVTAIGGMHTKQDYTTFYNGLGGFGWRGWGGGGFGETNTSVDQIPVGTLIVDIYQTGTKQLIFRGEASNELSNNSQKNTGKLDKAIAKIFDKFPPKS